MLRFHRVLMGGLSMIGAPKRSGRTRRQRIAAATAGLLALVAATVSAAPDLITVTRTQLSLPFFFAGWFRVSDYTTLNNGSTSVVLDNLNNPALFRPSAGVKLFVGGIPFFDLVPPGLPTGASLDCDANIWTTNFPELGTSVPITTIDMVTGAVTAEDGSVVATMSPAPLTSSILYPGTC